MTVSVSDKYTDKTVRCAIIGIGAKVRLPLDGARYAEAFEAKMASEGGRS